jgi:hypothetical protein
MITSDQSKYKLSRDKWRLNNPNYAKEYYLLVKNTPEFKEKARIRAKKWRDNNKEKEKITHSKWQKNNKDAVNKINKKWKDSNKEKYLSDRRQKEKRKRESDSFYKFSQNIRILISSSFKRGNKKIKKTTCTENIIGCSIDFFIEYILSKCPEGTELKDFKRFGYHIDHIIPISIAKTEEEIIKLNHYTNLQPLWWKDNLSKSNKLIKN